jgi:hypothetical protein
LDHHDFHVSCFGLVLTNILNVVRSQASLNVERGKVNIKLVVMTVKPSDVDC